MVPQSNRSYLKTFTSTSCVTRRARVGNKHSKCSDRQKDAVWNTAETCFRWLSYRRRDQWIHPSIYWPIHPSITSLILSGGWRELVLEPQRRPQATGRVTPPPQVASSSRSATQTQRTTLPIWNNQLSPSEKQKHNDRSLQLFGWQRTPTFQRIFFLRGQGEVDVIDLAIKSRQRSGLWERDEGMMNPE